MELSRTNDATWVSILVLMDVVREARNFSRNTHGDFCFNPCSNGCRSGSPVRSICATGGRVVSILVLMDVVREASFHYSGKVSSYEFQSLF